MDPVSDPWQLYKSESRDKGEAPRAVTVAGVQRRPVAMAQALEQRRGGYDREEQGQDLY